MVIVRQAGANLSLPIPTISHAALAKSIGDLGLVYQCLPLCRSEFGPVARGLYQTLPPRTRDRVRTHICRVIMERVARVGSSIHSHTQWRTADTLRKGHTVVVGIAKKNLFHQAGRLVKNRAWW